MPAKLVVTERKGGSRISLLGSSGKELLVSTVFTEPRAKGATLRALKGLLGDVSIEDHTLKVPGRGAAVTGSSAAKATLPAKPAVKAGAKRGRPAAAARAAAGDADTSSGAAKPAAKSAAKRPARKTAARRVSSATKSAVAKKAPARKVAAAARKAPVAKTVAPRRQAAAKTARKTATARV